MSLADSLARRHDRRYFSTKPSPCAVPSGTGGSTVDKPAETESSIRLASHLVKAPNSRSGGHEFKSPRPRELGALTKSGKTLGVRSFYKALNSCGRGGETNCALFNLCMTLLFTESSETI